LDFPVEPFDKVFVDNAVCCKECKDVRDKVALVVVDAFLPIMKILREVHLLSSPGTHLGLLVYFPYLMVLDGEEDKTTRRLLQKRLVLFIQVDFANKTRPEVLHRILLKNRGLNNSVIVLSNEFIKRTRGRGWSACFFR